MSDSFENLYPELASVEDQNIRTLVKATCISKSVARGIVESNFNGFLKDQILSALNLS